MAVKRIAFLLRGDPGRPDAEVSAIVTDAAGHLREMGAEVEYVFCEASALDLTHLRPRHDLYVLRSQTPLALSVAGALTAAGGKVINTWRSYSLTRDKIASLPLLAAAGVPVPASWTTGEPGRMKRILAEQPLWLKEPRGSRGAGVRRLAEPDEMDGIGASVDSSGLPLPLFAQAEAPGSGLDYKAYVVGDEVWARLKPYPARTPEEKAGVPAPVPPAIREAALAANRALGLRFSGVDFRVSGERFTVIDVNPFSGFKGVAEAGLRLAELFMKAARGEPERGQELCA